MAATSPKTAPSPSPSLPNLVWRRIVYYLSDGLPQLLNVASLNADLQRICRPYISSFFRAIAYPLPPLSSDYYYHDLAWLVLDGYIDPLFVTAFQYVGQYNTKPRPTSAPGTIAASATYAQKRRLNPLLEQAVRTAPYMPSDLDASEVCSRFHQGDADAALLVLLSQFARLKMLEPPVKHELCAAFFQSVAHEYQRRGTNAVEARRNAISTALRDRDRTYPSSDSREDRTIPFAELLILYVHPHQHGYSFPLTDMLPFMGIPSLQRIVLSGMRDREFPKAWPADEVHPTCPEIYFSESSVSREAVLNFADGLGPCEIRQWYERPRVDVCESDPNDPTWDRILITTVADGSKSIDLRLDYDGGNPGYEHAWVSWLCRGKMWEWSRIDEKFELEDGDEDIDQLQGLFA